MCFNRRTPPTPKPQPIVAPPPVKPLEIAKTSKLDPRRVELEKKKPVAYGAKSLRDPAKAAKRDASSLLIPLNTGETKGGINA
tara:strand:+ start:1537 stop:1785 length:249 start_codon:yes stop_codon:yes gene_type:complete